MHTFTAWIDKRGSNEDRHHNRLHVCVIGRCQHLRLFDLDTKRCKCIVRVIRRRKPLYLSVRMGPKYLPIIRIGRKI